jgi:hypothetical protein
MDESLLILPDSNVFFGLEILLFKLEEGYLYRRLLTLINESSFDESLFFPPFNSFSISLAWQ